MVIISRFGYEVIQNSTCNIFSEQLAFVVKVESRSFDWPRLMNTILESIPINLRLLCDVNCH